jgi:hypothetical protein
MFLLTNISGQAKYRTYIGNRTLLWLKYASGNQTFRLKNRTKEKGFLKILDSICYRVDVIVKPALFVNVTTKMESFIILIKMSLSLGERLI